MISQEEYIKTAFDNLRTILKQELAPGRELSLALTDIEKAELIVLRGIGLI